MPANLKNSAVVTGLEKVSLISIPKKVNAKECSNYHTIALISHGSKVMLKILQARLQQYVNCELPDVQAGFRKGRGTRDQIAKFNAGSSKKQESSRKASISALLTTPKPLTMWITTNSQFSHSVVFDSLRPHGLHHSRLPWDPIPSFYNKLWNILKEMGVSEHLKCNHLKCMQGKK